MNSLPTECKKKPLHPRIRERSKRHQLVLWRVEKLDPNCKTFSFHLFHLATLLLNDSKKIAYVLLIFLRLDIFSVHEILQYMFKRSLIFYLCPEKCETTQIVFLANILSSWYNL